MLVLDELDHIASSTTSNTPLFTLFHSHASKLRVIGIANTHTLTSTSAATSISAHALAGVQTLHFTPYTPQQLLEIVQTRLTSEEEIESCSKSDAILTKFLPIPTLTLLTKKVAAMTGDVRTVFEVLRGAVDIAVNTTASADATGNPMNVSTPTVSPNHILSALKAYEFASTTIRPLVNTNAVMVRKSSDTEVVGKIRELGLQPRLALLSLLLARTRVDSCLPLTGFPAIAFSSSITARSPTKRSRSGASSPVSTSAVDVDILYTYYKSVLCRSEDGIFTPVSRSEFGDLLATLETVGLIEISSASASPGTPSKSGKRALSRTLSIGSAKGKQGAQLWPGVRLEEVCRGLGIEDNQDSSDLKAEEVRAIWAKEKVRIARELKAKDTTSVSFEAFEEAA